MEGRTDVSIDSPTAHVPSRPADRAPLANHWPQAAGFPVRALLAGLHTLGFPPLSPFARPPRRRWGPPLPDPRRLTRRLGSSPAKPLTPPQASASPGLAHNPRPLPRAGMHELRREELEEVAPQEPPEEVGEPRQPARLHVGVVERALLEEEDVLVGRRRRPRTRAVGPGTSSGPSARPSPAPVWRAREEATRRRGGAEGSRPGGSERRRSRQRSEGGGVVGGPRAAAPAWPSRSARADRVRPSTPRACPRSEGGGPRATPVAFPSRSAPRGPRTALDIKRPSKQGGARRPPRVGPVSGAPWSTQDFHFMCDLGFLHCPFSLHSVELLQKYN